MLNYDRNFLEYFLRADRAIEEILKQLK